MENYQIRKIDKKNTEALTLFFSQCHDYFNMVEGHPADEASLEEFFTDLPPNCILSDKQLFAVYKDEMIVAVIDLLKGYPIPMTFTIGLLLISPDQRGQGLGEKLDGWISDHVKGCGGRRLRIGVVTQNVRALNFWTQQNYLEISRTESMLFGDKSSVVIVFEKEIL